MYNLPRLYYILELYRAQDVITYGVRGVSVPEVAAILEMEGTDTVVEFYVTYGNGLDVVLDKEQVKYREKVSQEKYTV